ncbi:glycosyltransferase [Magnetovibrio blakemorei]|uniref:Glycosyltransferase 2-like domain-containing protein n=1 Tax=Magnetovibrio blakemorei TaxID=28181 RepID=A0A1E5QBY2_9PROT|nr:glycosyltransferase [Magnetovibrio blakemorei]OEJ69575.1 hypothetical protein BEN30_02550 [Magnetovibrio blakemorei]
MSLNTKLAIALPTYNRAITIDFFLKTYIPVVKDHNIGIYISNNASTDNTLEVIEKWKSVYPYIFCSGFDETVHVDINVENALKLSPAEYTWLIGDGYEIPQQSLEYLLNVLPDGSDKYDFVIANLVGRIKDIDEKIYRDQNQVLEDLAWMITCLGCTVYHKSVIPLGDYSRYRATEFGHVGFVFDILSKLDFKLLWSPNITIVTLKTPERKPGWGQYFLSNIFEKWPSFISLLPDSYGASSKAIAMRAFLQKSKLLGWRNMLTIRSQGFLNKEIYRRYEGIVSEVAPGFLKSYMLFLTYMPEGLCAFVLKRVEWIRRKNFQIRKAFNPDLRI